MHFMLEGISVVFQGHAWLTGTSSRTLSSLHSDTSNHYVIFWYVFPLHSLFSGPKTVARQVSHHIGQEKKVWRLQIALKVSFLPCLRRTFSVQIFHSPQVSCLVNSCKQRNMKWEFVEIRIHQAWVIFWEFYQSYLM